MDIINYNLNNEIVYKESYRYDDDDIVYKKTFWDEGEFEELYNKYDLNNNLIENNIFDSGTKYQKTKFKYNSLNDLIEAELKIIEAQDTTSKWYKEFYYHQFSEWSLSEISRIRNDYYNIGGGSSSSFTQSIPIKLQVTETFDSTGVAIIYEQENPYINIKVGDLLYIK